LQQDHRALLARGEDLGQFGRHGDGDAFRFLGHRAQLTQASLQPVQAEPKRAGQLADSR